MIPGPQAVLVGLGNPVLGDDGVGLRVAESVRARFDADPVAGVRVVSSTRGGLELLEILSGSQYAIVVDCLAIPDAQAGRIRELSLDDLSGSARLVGSHDIGLAAVVQLGRLLQMPMPDRVEIIGIEARLTGEIVEGLSPAIAAVVEPLAAQLYERLRPSASPTPRPESVAAVG